MYEQEKGKNKEINKTSKPRETKQKSEKQNNIYRINSKFDREEKKKWINEKKEKEKEQEEGQTRASAVHTSKSSKTPELFDYHVPY